MVSRDIVLDIWKDIPVTLENLSQIHFEYFRKIGVEKNIIIEPTLFNMKSLIPKKVKKEATEAASKIKKFLNQGQTIPLKAARRHLNALLMESMESMERSIFWFFNYRFNRKHGFIAPSVQSEYYSEFFALIGISRVLGIAVTHVPFFGPVLTDLNWKTRELHFRPITVHSAHIAHMSHLGRNIDRFPFIPDTVKIRLDEFRPEGKREYKDDDEIVSKFLMTDDRESYVYEFNVSSRVYSDISLESRSFCFIGGDNGKGIIAPTYGTDEGQYNEKVRDRYADYGFLEENIGSHLKTLINLLKDMSNNGVDSSLSWTKRKIEDYPHATEFETADILDWIS